MDEKELLHLISIFEKSSLYVMEIEKDQQTFRVRLEKKPESQTAGIIQDSERLEPLKQEQNLSRQQPLETKAEEDSGKNFEQVKAPIVGVFYEAPSPEEAPYVKLGQKVEKGQTLCLVEAMKMMNELKAPVSGVVRRILVENGAMVEFGQTLYEVEPC